MAKLRDWVTQRETLKANPNPFAAIVLAHLAAQETRQDLIARGLAKFALTRRLYNLGYDKAQILTLFNFIDWMLQLPGVLALQFRDAIQQFEEEHNMTYITSIERIGREEGLREGLLQAIEFGLDTKFGAVGLSLLPEIKALSTVGQVQAVLDRLRTATSLDEVRAAYQPDAAA